MKLPFQKKTKIQKKLTLTKTPEWMRNSNKKLSLKMKLPFQKKMKFQKKLTLSTKTKTSDAKRRGCRKAG